MTVIIKGNYLQLQEMLKPFLTDMANPCVSLTEGKWISIEKLEVLLRYPYILTKKFQGEDLTSGMFLKE